MWFKKCLLLLAIGYAQGRVRIDPLVDSQQGLIKGLRADDGDYSMFLGIPYAKVDENNPFGAASPHPKFAKVFEAYDDSAVCPQVEEFNNTIVGSLDCLNLNVFVPNKASSEKKLPVLVWIHGGGFTIGFGNRYLYGPKYLIRHDVVVVSINYRLGPYGFMCLDTPGVPGNQGLKDQVLALRWIKNNIDAFGGDPNEITIMGESSGAACVEFLMFHKEQENLFNKAIMQSGSAISPWVFDESDSSKPLKIAKHLGFQTEDVAAALNFLKSIDTDIVIKAVSELNLSFNTCIEKKFENVEAIIVDHPVNADYSKFSNISILAGFNSLESLVMYIIVDINIFKNVDNFANLGMLFNDGEVIQDMKELVRQFYIGDEEISGDLRPHLTNYQSDFQFNYPVQRTLQKYVENGAQNVYQYMFSYNGGRNFVKKRMNLLDVEGAAHADEIGYLFDLSYETDQPSEDDQRVIDQITALWTNFVKHGEPTPEVTELLPVKWIPSTKEINHYLDIDGELKMKKRPFHDRMAFWNLLYKANENRLKGKR